MTADPAIAAVAIGRNEGQRLLDCLAAFEASGVVPGRIVYVDSGSTDGSVAAAQERGIEVVELDTSVPFTAARARNAGFDALAERPEGVPEFVQFLDGDCSIERGWLHDGMAALRDDPELGLVTGWRSELYPDRSIYNALCDVEWHRPAGEIESCGGDMLVRSIAFQEIGGFNPTIIAAEDDDFCIRLRAAGWRLRRLPLTMTRHDAAMTHFGQWWRRAVRAGHGFAQLGALHPGYFAAARRRILVWGVLLPAIALVCLALQFWTGLTAVLALYLLSHLRTWRGLVQRDGIPCGVSARQAALLTLSKFPNLQGMLTYFSRRARGKAMQLIEYK